MPCSFLKTTSDSPDFDILVAQLNAHFAVLNGEKDDFYAQFNQCVCAKWLSNNCELWAIGRRAKQYLYGKKI